MIKINESRIEINHFMVEINHLMIKVNKSTIEAIVSMVGVAYCPCQRFELVPNLAQKGTCAHVEF